MAKPWWKARRLWLIVTGAALASLLAGALFVAHLDRIVTPQFEGRRWTLPAQVYAQPLELYAGLTLSADAIEQELRRLGYQRVDEIKRPGSYRRRGARLDLASRKVRFWDELREAQILSIVAGPRQLERLLDARGRDVPVFRLDPLLIGSIFPIHGEDRIVLAPDQVPELLPAALKVVEDRKFDTHHGVDPEAVLRALWANLRAGEVRQGGSTLTQQLVKNYFLDDRATLGRKLKEAVMALILEARFEKADLMNAYINEVYLGQEGERAIHGFGLASQFYFGKPLRELDLHEIALLVAVARGPSYYDPRRHEARARERRDLVLRLMAQFKVVPEATARRAMTRPLGVTEQGQLSAGYYPAYLEFVRRTLRRDYKDEDLTEAGLSVFTSLDPHVQAQAERALMQELTRLDASRRKRDSALASTLDGAVVVTAPQSGDVIAIVGGRRVGFDGFNRALDAKRSVGSLVKPFVYLTALETGRYNAASLVDDAPIEVKLPNGKVWRPENFTPQLAGPVPLVRALSQSMNLATVRLGMDVGVPRVAKTLQRMGLSFPPPQVPALLLGALDASPLEVAQLYNTLASGGFRTPLRAVRAVVDESGQALKSFSIEVTPVADPATVYQLDRMLVEVVERGTGRAARSVLPADLIVAGKSGTSSDFRDSWFAGFSGAHLAVVWIGYDDHSPTGLTGSSGALRVWSQLIKQLGTPSWQSAPPDSLEQVWIEYPTGLKVRPECAEDPILIAVPQGSELPAKPGCGDSSIRDVTGRARDWLRGIIGR